MKNIVAVLAIVMSTTAFAKSVPTPPVRPTEFNTPNSTGALVTPNGVIVKAPVGSNVTVDVDGNNVDVTVDKGDVWDTVLPWRWNLWK